MDKGARNRSVPPSSNPLRLCGRGLGRGANGLGTERVTGARDMEAVQKWPGRFLSLPRLGYTRSELSRLCASASM
jgi:hypothetical protein